MGYHYILSEHKDDVAYITINRPEKLNALNKLTIQELSDAIKKADRDTKVKCIILTGSGPKAFVAGADIKEFSHFTYQSFSCHLFIEISVIISISFIYFIK